MGPRTGAAVAAVDGSCPAGERFQGRAPAAVELTTTWQYLGPWQHTKLGQDVREALGGVGVDTGRAEGSGHALRGPLSAEEAAARLDW